MGAGWKAFDLAGKLKVENDERRAALGARAGWVGEQPFRSLDESKRPAESL